MAVGSPGKRIVIFYLVIKYLFLDNGRAGSDISKTSSSTRGLIKLRGYSVKSDSDSGIDGDSLVGEIKIKQVGRGSWVATLTH